jgi:hypothetical protein
MVNKGMLLSALKAASWTGLALLFGCGFNATSDPAPSASARQVTAEDPCEPTFLKVNEKPLEVSSGYWRFGFDIFLVGCQDELNQITEEGRQKVADLLQERVGEGGLSFFADQYERDGRKKLVADLNTALDGPVLGDILTVIRSSIEHEPGPS